MAYIRKRGSKWQVQIRFTGYPSRTKTFIRKEEALAWGRLKLRKFKARWGGMSSKSILTLNPDLVRAPLECIDYVITHELCHIEFSHHGPEFWTLLQQKLPDWQRLKHKLEMSLK